MNPLQLTPDCSGIRLDAWLSTQLPDLSRARIQSLLKAGHITVSTGAAKPSTTVHPDMIITVSIPPPESIELIAEDIPLTILHEDSDVLVIDKQPGLVVHPAAGHETGTLVNALLFHCTDLEGIGGEQRPGIVHRLDKDTSGLMVIAKNERAMNSLTDQFKSRTVQKRYHALVWGHPSPDYGTLETQIGRSQHDRKKMSTTPAVGRDAVTHYATLSTHGPCTLMECKIETGRTHQIRVHMAHLKHPIVGDSVYGWTPKREEAENVKVQRQLLHAHDLSFTHPATDDRMSFQAPKPPAMRAVIERLDS